MPHDGQWGDVLFTHPPAAISFTVELPADPVALQTRIALDPQSWAWGGNGVTFLVTVQEEGQPPADLYRAHLPYDESGHDWQEVLVPLAPYAGKQVLLTLATDSGPQGDCTGD